MATPLCAAPYSLLIIFLLPTHYYLLTTTYSLLLTTYKLLELLICTIDDGIRAAAHVLLPQQAGVCYLVSWQQTSEGEQAVPEAEQAVPEALKGRDDVRVFTMKGRGLSANRNNALQHARGDILLFADDDCRYRPEYFERVREAFAAHPEADIITFQGMTPDGLPMHHYSPTPYLYAERPRGSFVSSWEIACRREPHGFISKEKFSNSKGDSSNSKKNSPALPLFDERFGLGSEIFGCGEEEVFIHEAHCAGLTVLYLPEVVVQTDAATTGRRFLTDAAVQRAKGAVLRLMHGPVSARLRCLKAALLLPRGVHRWRILREMWRGARLVSG